MGNNPTTLRGTDEDEAYLSSKKSPPTSPVRAISKRTAVLSGSGKFSGYGSDGNNSKPSSLIISTDSDTQEDESPLTPSQIQKRVNTLSFIAHYFIEHLVDGHADTVSSICLKYDLPSKDTLIEVNASVSSDDESLFHVHQVYIPVDQSNCNVVKLAHKTLGKQFTLDISNWEERKLLTRQDVSEQTKSELAYEDEYVACTDDGLVLKQYYWPHSENRSIAFDDITNVESVKISSLRGAIAIPTGVFVERFIYPQPDNESGFMLYEKGRTIGTFIIAKQPKELKEIVLEKINNKNEKDRNLR
jgi:hypothetical protein